MSPQLIACDGARLGAILEILNEAIEHSTAVYDYRARTPSTMQAWFEAKQRAGYPVIGAVDAAGALLGFGSFGPFRAWPAYKYTLEHSLYVHPAWRGQGIGSLLLAELVARATQANYHVLIGAVDAGNGASIALHRRLGFEQCAHIRHAGFKFNRWLDLLLFQRLLQTPAQPVDG
ncbi:MAG TPA: GNAT family N-acetyltransferase [Steroidobacteraceae bacterium]|jgi:phosphinothricin acetyltransferase